MKKIFAILFLFIFLFNAMGYFVLFQLEQYTNKKEMRSNIDLGVTDERISIVTIDNNQVNSSSEFINENENEFSYKGEIYDIISKKITGNKTTFYALKDTKEQSLFSALTNHVNSNSEFGKGSKHPIQSKNFSKNFVKTYFYQSITFLIHTSEKSILFPTISIGEYSVDFKAELLPPELV